jgi:prepilin-type N-terminal cleavage/methylation domain-containing protein
MNKRGFTLLELIVVIIILGILATLGFTQYARVIEKGRLGEALNNLGMLRKMSLVYYQEHGTYEAYTGADEFGLALPSGGCNTNFYFAYNCDGTGNCIADRCSSGGKPADVNAADVYSITLDMPGTISKSGSAP